MDNYLFLQIEFMSPEYDLCVRLRDALLRKPLNLEFTERQLEEECNEFHFGIFDFENNLFGCLSFKPLDAQVLKMRQVAIAEHHQNKGIGKFLVNKSEEWALENHFQTIVLHARDSAVSFYKKMNYQTEGNMFEEVNIPHWAMRKNLKH